MKTFTFISIFLLLFSIKNKAQEYFPFVQDSKTWSEVTTFHSLIDTNYRSFRTTSYKLEGDFTSENGKVYKQFFTCDSDPTISEWVMSDYAYREDSGKVFRTSWYTPDEEELVYDFMLHIGDSALYHIYDFPFFAHVNLVDSILITGTYRKQIHFNYPQDIWVEGLGSMFRPFMPLEYNFIYPNGFGLLCVSDTTGSVFVNPIYGKCYIDTVMTNISEPSSTSSIIHISNNPMHDFSIVDIENSLEQFNKYSLYNSNGLLVRKEIIKDRTFTIQRKNLSSGIYILKIFGKNDVISKKLVIY